jgi:hypothetical protein
MARLQDSLARAWDLGNYYQGPFVNALEAWDLAADVRESITTMKGKRNVFTWRQKTKILAYCLDECRALSELASCLEDAHIAADLEPRSWHGPGSTASVLLSRHSIHERRGVIPPEVQAVAQIAYFGGRAEISCNGVIDGPVYAYDISSAYPHHASQLPCLEHGYWKECSKEGQLTSARTNHAIVRGHIENSRGDWGPLPVRLKNGSIVFPLSGASGWWWRDEWCTARAHWPGLRFERAYTLHSDCECKPFAFLRDVFLQRLAVGKETGGGKILKLGMNSVYGKLAQAIGGAKYASRVWSGMLTSSTRAQVLKLMMQHKRQDSVIMIATDGLFSTELHPVPAKVELGGWERTTHEEGLFLVRPGIYSSGGKLRARGLGRDNLNEEARARLARGLLDEREQVVLAPRTVFAGAKRAVYATQSGDIKRSRLYGQWHTIPTHVSLAPGPKRAADWSPPRLNDVDSAPYGDEGSVINEKLFAILELFRELEG